MPPGAQAKKYIAPWGNFILSRLFFFVNTFFKNFLKNFYAEKYEWHDLSLCRIPRRKRKKRIILRFFRKLTS